QTSIFVITTSTSKIKASSYTAYVGVKNTYTVTLTAGDTPLSGRIITFKINGKTVSKKTDSNGKASIDISEAKGSYKLSYSYAGEKNIKSTSGTVKITVKKGMPTKIAKANSIIYRNKKAAYFKIKLTDARGNILKSKKVTFKLNGKKYIRKTNSKGIATIKIKLKTGTYKIKVSFAKKSPYNKASKTFKIKVKPKQARNNGIWLLSLDMQGVNFKTLQKYGTKHIFLNAKAIERFGKTYVETWIKDAKAHGIKVHLWMQVFYTTAGGWKNPIKKGKLNYNLLNSKVKEAKTLAKVKGVAGVHFDYVRYPGNAFQYKNSIKAVNYFVKKASTSVHKVNKKLIVSAAVMPEPSSMKKYYAQDIPTMSKYVDVIVPMVYKGNYHAGTKWIKSVTKAFAKQSKKAKIWTGLQTYKSDSKLNKLSAKELMGDADAAALGGAYGVMLFRYGLINYINFNNV
ncbi:MAG: Ig-like domain repeat protein, partial [Methanobrevibacter sp.]|nr:Ig-like domain repeat protein [Methanobrevibacter sp.]